MLGKPLANVACRRWVEDGVKLRFHAPLLEKTKAEIIRWGTSLGVDYSSTWSCYAPHEALDEEKEGMGPGASAIPCGECDSCLLRKRGFREAEVEDPTKYWVA